MKLKSIYIQFQASNIEGMISSNTALLLTLKLLPISHINKTLGDTTVLGFSGIVTKWLHFSSSPTHALGCIVRGWNIFDSLYVGAGDHWLYVENILLASVKVKIPESKEWKKIRGDKSMDTRCLAMLDGPLIILVLLHSYNIRESSIMPWHLSQLQLQTYSYVVQNISLRTQPVR